MSRLLFARGSRGGIIRAVQQNLATEGCYTGIVDGQYGGGTERAVSSFQTQAALPITGSVDDVSWTALMRQPVPSIFERALQLTAAFEGHGFTIVEGNWDKAWLTWGIIGFTLKHGQIQEILLEIESRNPAFLRDAFGDQSAMLLKVIQSPPADQESWANSISEGANVKEPWRSGFQRLGNQPVVQGIQLERARVAYFQPAVLTATAYELISERGLALAFDVHVQNGGVNKVARAAILKRKYKNEPARRVAIASAVANAAKAVFRADVLARKLTIATGSGIVHGEAFSTDRWGIEDYAAFEQP